MCIYDICEKGREEEEEGERKEREVMYALERVCIRERKCTYTCVRESLYVYRCEKQ